MFRLEVTATLTPAQRRAVDRLIVDVWSYEAKSSKDVQVLVPAGSSVVDPLDECSAHLLVWSEAKLVGYSRLSIFRTPEALAEASNEVPRLDEPFVPTAYLSRLVVDPRFRGQGIARLLDDARVEIAHDSGAELILVCAVGTHRQASLGYAGFVGITEYSHFQTGWYRTSRPTHVMKLHLFPTYMSQVGTSL